MHYIPGFRGRARLHRELKVLQNLGNAGPGSFLVEQLMQDELRKLPSHQLISFLIEAKRSEAVLLRLTHARVH